MCRGLKFICLSVAALGSLIAAWCGKEAGVPWLFQGAPANGDIVIFVKEKRDRQRQRQRDTFRHTNASACAFACPTSALPPMHSLCYTALSYTMCMVLCDARTHAYTQTHAWETHTHARARTSTYTHTHIYAHVYIRYVRQAGVYVHRCVCVCLCKCYKSNQERTHMCIHIYHEN